jgi:lipopolysaccharide export system permease protein
VPRFDRYLLSQLLALFGFFSLLLVSVYWINRAVGLFDQLIADGQSGLVFIEFSLLTLPNVIRLVLPISAFAAAIYVANRLMNDSELVVMQATGFSSFRLVRPVLYFGLTVTVMLSVLTHVLVPASRATLAARSAEISENVTARFVRDGEFMHPADGVTLYIRRITETGELRDVFVADDRSPGQTVISTARRALLARGETGPKLLMFDGSAQTLDKATGRLAVTRFADVTYDLTAMLAGDFGLRPSIDELTTTQLLQAAPETADELGLSQVQLRQEGHSRIAQPFLAIATALIGFSALLLGGFSRFGQWRQIAVAVALLIVVQMINTQGNALAMSGLSAWPAVYLGPIAGMLMAVGLLWLSQRPRRQPRQTAMAGGVA